jgi:solute carrier family 35 protein F5
MSSLESSLSYSPAGEHSPTVGRSTECHERHVVPSIHSHTKSKGFRESAGLENIARRTLGIMLLLTTVVLWTASNFMSSVRFSLAPVYPH